MSEDRFPQLLPLLQRVQDHVGAQPARDLPLPLRDLEDDHLPGRPELEELEHPEPDGPGADHHGRIPGPEPGHPHTVQRGGEGLDDRRLLEGHLVRQPEEHGFRVLYLHGSGKRPVVGGRDPDGAGEGLDAQGELSFPAEGALPAFRNGLDGHPVPRPPLRHTIPRLHHGPDGFVPHHRTEGDHDSVQVPVDVRAADPAQGHVDQHLAGIRDGPRPLLELQLLQTRKHRNVHGITSLKAIDHSLPG